MSRSLIVLKKRTSYRRSVKRRNMVVDIEPKQNRMLKFTWPELVGAKIIR